MERYYVFRLGSNAANQPMTPGPVRVAEVLASSPEEACRDALQRITVYNGQHMYAESADEVDALEDGLDSRVKIIE